MQNRLKISPRISLEQISPVMVPSSDSASRRSSARRSVGMPASSPADTFPRASELSFRALACRAFVTRISSESEMWHVSTSAFSSFSMPERFFALIERMLVLLLSESEDITKEFKSETFLLSVYSASFSSFLLTTMMSFCVSKSI